MKFRQTANLQDELNQLALTAPDGTKAALQLLGLVPLADKVVVGDVLFCQRDVAEAVVANGGDYVLMVKDNQPSLHSDVAAGFGFAAASRAIAEAFSPQVPAPTPEQVATASDKAHGRSEKRTLRTTTILTVHERWSGLAQGFELTRERTVQGTTSVEVVYGITSLAPAQADARRLLALVRNHWRIENCLHFVRDVTLGEDRCRVRTGSAPQVLAGLRNAVIHLLASVAAPSRVAAIEQLSARPPEALELIGITQVTRRTALTHRLDAVKSPCGLNDCVL